MVAKEIWVNDMQSEINTSTHSIQMESKGLGSNISDAGQGELGLQC